MRSFKIPMVPYNTFDGAKLSASVHTVPEILEACRGIGILDYVYSYHKLVMSRIISIGVFSPREMV